MDIKKLILERINQGKELKVVDIVKITGFSRAYISRFFKDLRDEGQIILIGKANQAVYVKADKQAVLHAKQKILKVNKYLKNVNLSEDIIFEQIKLESGIFIDVKENVLRIVKFAFTEMLNNAIEHSVSNSIIVRYKRDKENIRFRALTTVLVFLTIS